MTDDKNAYDLVPYPGQSFASTHPNSMAVQALMHGLNPAPVERCRVLEIGCNEGINLISMAYAMPGSQFVGVDLAAQPILRGQERVREVGLVNIQLFQADLTELDSTLGEFDYIIAHGVYAWVPEPVRDALLALCRTLLAANGVAFISYNALPGGHLRNLAAEILSHAKRDGTNCAVRLDEALNLLDFVAASRPQEDAARRFLEGYSAKLRTRSQNVVFHDELAPAHRPVSFTEFVQHAARHGLRWISDSQLPPPTDCSYKPQIVEKVRQFSHGDPVAEEQMFDLVRMRMYRETLLCRAECAVDHDLCVEAIQHMRFASKATRRDAARNETTEYVLPGGIAMDSGSRPTRVLMDYLISVWPRSVSFSDVAALLDAESIDITADVVRLIMQLVVSRFIDLHVWEPPMAEGLAERPRGSAVALAEAKAGTRVTTLRHETMDFSDAMSRQLFLLLDGTRDRDDLRRELIAHFPELPPEDVSKNIENALQVLYQSAVLIGG